MDDGKDTQIKFGIDWLSFTFHPATKELFPEGKYYGDDTVLLAKNAFRDQVLYAASVALGCTTGDWVDLAVGMFGYHKVLLGPGGARILYDAPGRDDFHVSFPGEACGLISEAGMRSWMHFALVNHGVPKRCDINIDDHRSNATTPADVLRAIQGPDVVTHASTCLVQQGWRVGSMETTGHTVYLGQAGSRQRLRVYDKNLESGGAIPAIRWELESKNEPAETLVPLLANGDWGAVIKKRLVGFVDFRDSTKAVNSSAPTRDRPRLKWFQDLVDLVVRGSAYLPQAPRTIDDVISWVTKQAGTSLAVMFAYWGGDYSGFVEIINDGRERAKPKHTAVIPGIPLIRATVTG
jgi:DNA relaxase NicK